MLHIAVITMISCGLIDGKALYQTLFTAEVKTKFHDAKPSSAPVQTAVKALKVNDCLVPLVQSFLPALILAWTQSPGIGSKLLPRCLSSSSSPPCLPLASLLSLSLALPHSLCVFHVIFFLWALSDSVLLLCLLLAWRGCCRTRCRLCPLAASCS